MGSTLLLFVTSHTCFCVVLQLVMAVFSQCQTVKCSGSLFCVWHVFQFCEHETTHF